MQYSRNCMMRAVDMVSGRARSSTPVTGQGGLGSRNTIHGSIFSKRKPALHTSRRGASQGEMLRVRSFIPPHIEPENALSLPTWAVHTSSVFEWGLAMRLMWKYGEVSGNPRWKGMSWGMMPCLGSAMCACTWHFFYNATELEFLVALQAFLTIVGNATCWIAAYRIYKYSSSKDDGDDGTAAGDLMLASEE